MENKMLKKKKEKKQAIYFKVCKVGFRESFEDVQGRGNLCNHTVIWKKKNTINIFQRLVDYMQGGARKFAGCQSRGSSS